MEIKEAIKISEILKKLKQNKEKLETFKRISHCLKITFICSNGSKMGESIIEINFKDNEEELKSIYDFTYDLLETRIRKLTNEIDSL